MEQNTNLLLPTNWIRKIDRTAKTIIVYRDFLVAAGEYGSAAFEMKMELLAKYPGFDFIQDKPNRAKTDVVVDKFGKQNYVKVVDDKHFEVTLPVSISPQFFSWVFGLGDFRARERPAANDRDA